MTNIQTVRFRVYGIVQGVGFRPTVDRHAAVSGIRGSVCNKGPYVEIIAQGGPAQVRAFGTLLREQPPRRAAILKIDEKAMPGAPIYDDFRIVVSEKTEGEIYISPDIAICEDCARELYDPQDRRYLHPFINCTCCGPRLTILDALPYDRERTSMKMFPMCKTCAEEYHSPASRRYDAQPVCCNECGPQVYLLPSKRNAKENPEMNPEMNPEINPGKNTEKNPEKSTGKSTKSSKSTNSRQENNTDGSERSFCGRDAITAARRTILDGGIVAVKGIGGFHLCCDATNEEAVHSLRMRKRRPAKPFAVMMREEETVLRECLMNEEQRRILTGHQKPILLLERRKDPDAVFSRARKNGTGSGLSPDRRKKTGGSLLAPSVAPGNPRVGVMLPYTPLHMLLFRYDDGLEMPDCLIMTSGNVSGAPICRDDADVLAELSGFCDCILSHDRLIRIRADDTVMDFHRGHPYMIRRSRGYAPLPVLMSGEKLFPGGITARPETGVPEARRGDGWFPDRDPQEKGSCILAIGGELKNTFCIASGNLFYLSPYVGDLEDLRTVRALKETSARMEALLEVSPAAVVCDLHPKYNSTAVAEEMAAEKGIPLFRIQHHYAHVLSCMAENDRTDRVIGVSFDGTGYGTDGTIWGGEILLADCRGFRRAYAIRPFLQIGGDSAPRQGWRVAASMIWFLCKKQQGAPEDAAEAYFRTLEQLSLCDIQNAKAQRMMAERRIQAVSSTSAGRLFDAVSAMLGICRESTYEGEASIELQFAAERYAERKDPERAVQERAAAKRKGCIPALRKEPAAENQCPEDAVLKRDRLQTTPKKEEIPEEPRTGHDFPGNDFQGNDFRGDSPEPPVRFLETDRLFAALLQEKLRGADPEKLAYDFHEKLAGMIVEACVMLSAETGIRTAALTGGCFQNRLLLSLTEAGLQEKGLEVLIHHLVPPNDGGIALGQALAGRFLLGRESSAGHGSFQI